MELLSGVTAMGAMAEALHCRSRDVLQRLAGVWNTRLPQHWQTHGLLVGAIQEA